MVSKHRFTKQTRKIQPIADFGCVCALCVSLVGPVVIVVCFANRVAEQWLTKLFYVPVRIRTCNDSTNQKTVEYHHAQKSETVLDNS